MVKRVGYIAGRRVKVAGEQIVTATKLQRLTTPLFWVTASGDIAATDLDLDAVMVAAGSEVPAGAIGVIIQAELHDSAGLPLLYLYKDATETDIDQYNYLQAQVNNVWNNWQGVVELSPNNTIRYLVTGTSGDMSLRLKLMGWVIAAE